MHLSSDLSKNAVDQRTQQLETVYQVVQAYPDTLILGDFNMSDDGDVRYTPS